MTSNEDAVSALGFASKNEEVSFWIHRQPRSYEELQVAEEQRRKFNSQQTGHAAKGGCDTWTAQIRACLIKHRERFFGGSFYYFPHKEAKKR